MAYISDLTAYVKANAGGDPFKVRRGTEALADAIRVELWMDPAALASLKQIEATARSLVGVCALHVDNEWSSARRAVKWWQRRKFDKDEDQWKAALAMELTREAKHDVESIRWNF